jgi:cob(I)alamin adenosyltransferase
MSIFDRKVMEDSMEFVESGFVHVYTGNGKGKTTAAFGLALRAAASGMHVFIGQFVKGMEYGEMKIAQLIPNVVLEQFGRGCFIEKTPALEDFRLAREGLGRSEEVLAGGSYGLVVLDEIFIAHFFGLISSSDILNLMNLRNARTELVLTGRKAPQEIIDRADLVTEMVEIKHYYARGVRARKGIEF